MKASHIALLCLVSGAVGGLISQTTSARFAQPAQASQSKDLQANSFTLVDISGRTRAKLAFSADGDPSLWLMDKQNRPRVNLGLYSDGTGFLVFNNQQGQAVQILRSFGEGEAPLHIFKSSGQDIMITGLNPKADKTPFLFYYDDKRERKVQFGRYEGP
jgi:hypothetical protein